MNNIMNLFKNKKEEKMNQTDNMSNQVNDTNTSGIIPPKFTPTEKQIQYMNKGGVRKEEPGKSQRVKTTDNSYKSRNNSIRSQRKNNSPSHDARSNDSRKTNFKSNNLPKRNNSSRTTSNIQGYNKTITRNSSSKKTYEEKGAKKHSSRFSHPTNQAHKTTPHQNSERKHTQYHNSNITSQYTTPTQPHSQSHGPRTSSSPNLQLCTLSGTNEIGRNCSFIEYNNSILIIDCGFGFPEQELYGVDYMIPNTTYLEKNKHKIKGILITHGHLDHTGALPYVLPKIDYPTVYAGKFASALIKERLEEFEINDKTKIVDVHRNTTLEIGPFKVNFIGVTHSIPNAFSIFIESAGGNVFFSGDYKIDLEPANEEETDYSKLKQIAGKADMALMESTNATGEGKAKSATTIAQNLQDVVANHKGRVIIASFSSLVSRIYSLIQIAMKTNRKVVVIGRSLNTALKIAQEQRYVTIPANLVIKDTQVKDYSDNQIMIICTGSQGESNSALSRIALGEHKTIKAKQGDLVMLSASEIPDNITAIQHMTDKLIQAGADIIKNSSVSIHESGHGLIEDMRMMYEMVQPRYVMPIHGWLTLRYLNKKNYVKWGMPDDNVVLTEDGQIWELQGKSFNNPGKWVKTKLIDAKPYMIDGTGVGNVGEAVIKMRQQLAEYGVLTVLINLSAATHKILGRIKLDSRGFIYMQSAPEFVKELTNVVKDAHQAWFDEYKHSGGKIKKSKMYDNKLLKEMVERGLGRFINKKIDRRPVILVWTV